VTTKKRESTQDALQNCYVVVNFFTLSLHRTALLEKGKLDGATDDLKAVDRPETWFFSICGSKSSDFNRIFFFLIERILIFPV